MIKMKKKQKGDDVMKNQFDLDLQVTKSESASKELQADSGIICTPTCLTSILNCYTSISHCGPC
ncbi:FDLD family class I lanthipeptide [Paenibacillus polymyxa]|nr:FDLD family class I lanthipeptide [Paenibacillus polymyxa]WPQ58312.1 FDLD family class I lanthipeptide [Paenibacillus polymyxa]